MSDIDKKVRGRPIFAKVGIAVAIFLCFTELGTSPWRPSGIPSAVVFFAVAIGLLKRNRWSGYGGALFLAAEYVGSMVEFARFGWPTWLSLAGPVALHGSLAYLLFRAGRALSGNGVRIFKWLWIVPAVGELLFALLFASFTESIGAMEPTLLFGDFLVIRVLAVPAPVHAGLIAYLSDGRMYVVRCIGVPGDRIKIVNKQVYLNGGKLDEPYAYHKKEYIERYRDNFPSEPDRHIFGGAWDMLGHHVENGEVVVPPNSFFVMGDNRDVALDSRYFGFLPRAYVIGTPSFIYWSYEISARILSGNDPDAAFDIYGDFFTKTRWERAFMPIR